MKSTTCGSASLAGSILWLIIPFSVTAADNLTVLPKDSRSDPKSLLRSHLRTLAHQALDRRLERLSKLKTRDQLVDYQRRQRERLIEQLGGFPERTPLQARTVGHLSGDGFRAEKILFHSRPGFVVSGILYLPLGDGPFPAVLHPCGHTENGKAAEAYQRASILLARNGMACFCFDPIGQGERKQLLAGDTAKGQFRSTSEHMLEGVHPILLGENLATYMIWDGIRAIDYLCQRDDINARLIGCTGNSGGGNMTSFLMAIDERIVCAAPGCFVTTTRIKNDRPGPGDAEQNIFGQTRWGIDHPDFILMRAPRPTLICAATRDFVPIEGTWIAFRQAKQWYTRWDHAERVDLVETDQTHGFSRQLREAVARWMSRWLLKRDVVIRETEFEVFAASRLQCTPRGQVLLMDGATSVFELYKSRAEELAKGRSGLTTDDALRERIRRRIAVRPLEELKPRATIIEASAAKRKGYQVQRLLLRSADDFPLPALCFRPHKPTGRRVLYLHGKGKATDAAEGGPIARLAESGVTVLAVDLTGLGETESRAWRYSSMATHIGNNAAEFYVAYMLGRSVVGIRTEDTILAARYLQQLPLDVATDKPGKVEVVAIGEASIPALHAAALLPGRFQSVATRESIESWQELFATPTTRQQLINTVHGALIDYDLPDLKRLAGSK